MNFENRRLVKQMLAGEERAFDRFFDEYFPGLYRFAMTRMDGNPDGAEEVAQATLCAAISKLATYRGEAALFTWLCTFCRHEISAWYRRRDRPGKKIDLVEDSPEVAGALDSLRAVLADGPESRLEQMELTRLVHVALDRLPGRYANALEWKYLEGVSVREIAQRLDLSTKAAESLLTRARGAFRDGFSSLTGNRLTLRGGTI
ncbi:MAG: sigma-70 family RNA polymerase sigma factor [Acidobacteria bacterium]|uniref:Sigma-70 family RNA polymerase sigma factor n=1 Tax=Candidatus Polarisedimenticola svalbardensis TaxID=2886004 RepID=A0A8J6Y2N9_9BACT|nr:sigma-70 family RNA polymerase sigma factor [Candidatus Polarisedimenticola svalbardensis]